jgi:hypothetical protein
MALCSLMGWGGVGVLAIVVLWYQEGISFRGSVMISK